MITYSGFEDLKSEDFYSSSEDSIDIIIPGKEEKKKKKDKHEESMLRIKDLDLDFTTNKGTRLMLLGPSGSGKTNLLRCICKRYASDLDFIFMFNPSEHEEPWLPKVCRFNKVCIERIKQIWRYAKETKYRYKILIIIDDGASGKNILRSDFFQDFITRCRHKNVHIIVSIQYIKVFPPCFRDNIQRYFICAANNNTVKALYELSLGGINFYTFSDHINEAKHGKVALLDCRPGHNQLNYLSVPICEKFKIKL